MMKFPLTFAALALGSTLSAQDKPAEKITYADHVRPLLENKCFSCHNPDKKKGDLDLTSFAGTMAGGGGGSVVNAGDPDGSKLIASVLKKEEPFMPPEGAPMGAKDIETLHQWIQGGLLETSSSIAKKAAPKANLALASAPTGKPEGPPPVPEHVLLEPVLVAPRGTVVTALAASPWAPVIAVSGVKQALIYDAATRSLVGVYPYPEGYIRSLKFSQSGGLLVAGGGRGGKSGNAVVWDVKTGKRITEVGHEFDQVMGADISPNQAMIAIGSPSKKVKCFNASTGEELYIIKKHTEWVLQVAFSPDGVLLASADRNGGIMISEAANGGEFYVLDGHKASCTGLAWRSDSNVLASCSEDGKIAVWEMQNGKLVKSWDAHAGGVESVSFTPDGRIVSCGRDGVTRLWDINGAKLAQSQPSADLLTKVAGLSDSKTVAVGDWQGNVHFCSTDALAELGVVSSNPSLIAQRIADSERLVNELTAQIPASETQAKTAEAAWHAKETQLADLKKKIADATAASAKLEAEIKDWPNQAAALEKQRQTAQQSRDAQADAAKKYARLSAQMKQIETSLASLNAEKAKLTTPEQAPLLEENGKKIAQQSAQLEGLKKADTGAPQPITEFEKALKQAQDQLTAFNNAKPAKTKELEALKKFVADAPKSVADAEKQIADAKTAFVAEQKKGADLRTQFAWAQKQPTFLRAAQFNVTVLDEKQKLEKLEADVKAYQEATKETDSAKTAATQRLEDGKKVVAEATSKIPVLESSLSTLKADVPALEKSLEPLKQEEAQTAPKIADQKKALTAKETELASIEQEKLKQTTPAQRSVAEVSERISSLQKQAVAISGQLEAPQKILDTKKPELAKAEADCTTAKQPLADLDKTLAQATTRLNAATQSAQANPSEPNIKLALESATYEQTTAKDALAQANITVQSKRQIADYLTREISAADKFATALREQSVKVTADLESSQKALTEKQSALNALEKDFATKLQSVASIVAQLKTTLEPLEKQVTTLRESIATNTKTLEAKRVELAKTEADLGSVKQSQITAQKIIDTATKDIADKGKDLEEAKTELAKGEPQLEPQRAKVKQMTEQYFAMLPK